MVSACANDGNNTPPITQPNAERPTNNDTPQETTNHDTVTAHEDVYAPDYTEAARLYEAFLDAAATIENNPDAFLNTLLPHRPHLGVQYQRFTRFTSGTEYEWLAKTALERFILHETYLRPLYQLTLGNFDSFFGSESVFINDNIRSPLQNLASEGDGSEADAFKELMLWQFEYIINTGTAFNFITGQRHAEN